MSHTKRAVVEHIGYFGQVVTEGSLRAGPIPYHFTLNSPVGIQMDAYSNLWVCDTGNNRIIVFDAELNTIVHVLSGIGTKADSDRFLLPFHLCRHPIRNWMYCTDLGNGRVVVFEYDRTRVQYVMSFGGNTDSRNLKNEDFTPLSDPNGITVVKESDGSVSVFVCDEFNYCKTDFVQRNRCLKFTEDGRYLYDFRGIRDQQSRTQHDLIWPQGIGSDSKGNIYLANTGGYEVLKFNASLARPGVGDDCYLIADNEPVLLHSYGAPSGVGQQSVMRSVSVIGDLVFVPDYVGSTISVYGTDNRPRTNIGGIYPLWNHAATIRPRTAQDWIYDRSEDFVLANPYQVCGGEEEGIYFVTEPYLSSVTKLRIASFDAPDTSAELVTIIGNRRDNGDRKNTAASQFNCVTAVIGIERKECPPSTEAYEARAGHGKPNTEGLEVAASDRGVLFDTISNSLADVLSLPYRLWYGSLFKSATDELVSKLDEELLILDMGNWRLKTYREHDDKFKDVSNWMMGYFIPGNTALAVYRPDRPMLGQICPGTPLVFMTNFSLRSISIYQFNLLGMLVNYGVPFGMSGELGSPTPFGPQGIAVNDQGEIFVADSLGHRVVKWRLLQTGLPVFCKQFSWRKGTDADFTPSDIAMDDKGRLFVSDQFNNCIRVFDAEGDCLWSYGRKGYWHPDINSTMYDNFLLPASVCIDNGHLIVNDLVNRAIKVFKIRETTLEFVVGLVSFKKHPEEGGLWMPFYIYARNGKIFLPDCTYNVVNVFRYTTGPSA